MFLRYIHLFLSACMLAALSACVMEGPEPNGDTASEPAPVIEDPSDYGETEEPGDWGSEPPEPPEEVVIEDSQAVPDGGKRGEGPSRDREGTPSRDITNASQLEVVTDFLRPTQPFEAKVDKLPVGVLLLSKDDDMKSAILCDAFVKDLRTYAEAKEDSPEKDFFVTYWLLKEQPESTKNCSDLRAAYDFERAAEIKAQYGLQAVTGPVFLAIDANGDSVFLDLTDAGLDATRAAVTQWLTLALEASQPVQSDDLADVGDAEPKTVSGRYALGGFTLKMKSRMMSETSTRQLSNAYGGGDSGIQLFAYADTETGYRIGSTIRF